MSVLIIFVLCFESIHCIPTYWSGRTATSYNGTQYKQVPFIVHSENTEYNVANSTRDIFLEDRLGSITSLNVDVQTNQSPSNQTGSEHMVTLHQGFVTRVEVLNEQNIDGTVPVHISTSWKKVVEAESYDHSPYYLEEAVTSGNLLNMTLDMGWKILSQEESDKIDERRYWEIDKYLCYYQGIGASIVNDKCIVKYSAIIKYFLDLWQFVSISGYANAARTRVINDLDWLKETYANKCAVAPEVGLSCKNNSFERIEYISPNQEWLPLIKTWYRYQALPLAYGKAINVTYGYNKIKQTYDVNFTAVFEKWTFDFPSDFLAAYRDYSFVYDKLKLRIHYEKPGPTSAATRDAPSSFIIMIFVTIFPTFVLVIAILLFCLMCSRKGFSTKLWQYWAEERKQGEVTEQTAKEIKREGLRNIVKRRKLEEDLAELEAVAKETDGQILPVKGN